MASSYGRVQCGQNQQFELSKDRDAQRGFLALIELKFFFATKCGTKVVAL